MSTLSGKTIGKYQIESKLGSGGMAEVYKGYQQHLDRYVAIKFMHAFLVSEEGFLQRFKREAKAMAGLSHPNIVRVYDFDVYENSYYLVMEYIDGGTLKEHLQERANTGEQMSMDEAMRITTQVADALAYAHRRGMVHRDIKPANIMLDKDSGKAILTDFGIVKLMGNQSVAYTATGALIGTPAYMSPEQALGKPGDARADIYSLGVLLFQMITNQLPFDADTPLAVVMKHVNEPAPLPMTFNPNVPLDLQDVALKALAKDPEERYQTAGEFAAALRGIDLSKKYGGFAPPPVNPTAAGAAAMATATGSTAPGKTAVSPPTTPPPPEETAVAEPDDGKKRPIWLFALIGLVLIAVVIGSLFATGILGGNNDTVENGEPETVVVEEETDTPEPTEEPEEDKPTATPNALATQVALLSENATRDALPTDTPEATNTATPSRTPTATPNATIEFLSSCTSDANLVSALVDGRTNNGILEDQDFTAEWTLENSGSCPWPEGLLWTYVDGETFDFDTDLGIDVGDSVPAGEEVVLQADFTAPSTPGTYDATWQLVTEDGEPFTEPMEFDFSVFSRATSTPVASPTPIATNTPEVADVSGQVAYAQEIGNCEYPGGGTEWRCEVKITPYIDGRPDIQGQYTLFVFDQPAGQATTQRGAGPFYYFATARRCAVFNQGIRIVDDVTATEVSAPLYVDPNVYISGGCTLP